MRTLILGTRNKKKVAELTPLLAPLGIILRSLDDVTESIEVEESGDTFAENAALKAALQARHLAAWVLGEDSGLEVDALQGAPGVYSARYAGEPCSDSANNEKLLREMGSLPREQRTARYVCHIALAGPDGQLVFSCQEYCQGIIRAAYAGQNGFGYDPLFEIAEYHQTFGELGKQAKNILSHRGRASRRLARELARLIATDRWPDQP